MTVSERADIMQRLNALAQQNLTVDEHRDAIEEIAEEFHDSEAIEYFDSLIEKLNLIGTTMRLH